MGGPRAQVRVPRDDVYPNRFVAGCDHRAHGASISREKLARHQILVEEFRRKPGITADEAVLRAADGLVPSPRPAAELYTVTVDGLGREDPSAPGGYQNLIQDRLVWVVTFPSKLVSHGGDMFSGPTGGYSQSVVLMDAMTGEFLFADSYPG